MSRPLPLVFLCAALVAARASAQSETALKDFFEGKSVTVKLDMPATQAGIDVFADARRPLDFDEYSRRIKANGVSIKSGESVMVTKVRVKDKAVEFQLAGGGFGTVGDDSSTTVYVPSAAKTNREKALEKQVKEEKDPATRKRLQSELDDLRKAREREDHQNQVAAAAATEQKKQRVAEQRLHGGSRFNLRYQGAVPAGLTPGEVMAALADYVEFPFTDRVTRPGKAESPAERRPANAAIPRKGMSWQEAIEAFGAPAKQTSRMEGALKVTTAVFTREDQQIEAEFVEGVLIRYSIASK